MCNYVCDRCTLSRNLRYLPRAYALGDDRLVQMEQRHFWCATCKDISVGESLTRDESAQKMINENLANLRILRDTPKADLVSVDKLKRFKIESADKWIGEIEEAESDWQEWRARRLAGPKCLKCGSDDIDLPSERLSSFPHTGCGGTIQCLFTVGSHTGPAIYPHIYNIDGVLIKRGMKPKRVPGQFQYDYEPMELFCNEEIS